MDLKARVQLYPLLKRQEGDEHIVGRPEIGAFLYLPAEGVALIELLEQGKTLAEAAAEFQERYGETPDMADFVQTLAAEGFVQGTSTGELAAEVRAAAATATPRGHFAGIPQHVAARFFVRPLLWFYLLYIVGAVLIMAFQPRYIPRSMDQLWHPLVMVSTLGMMAGSLIFALVHELAHLLAARAKGVPATLGISRRALELVAITDISGLYSVEPKERYLPYLAGMLWDAFAGSTFIYSLAMSDAGLFALPDMVYGLFKAGAILCALRLAWQFQVHLRSDIYFVMANWLQTRNLHADSLGYLRNVWDRLRGRPLQHDLSALPGRERTVVQRYAWLLMLLLGFYWLSVIYLQLPFLAATVPAAVSKILAGWRSDPAAFGDSLVYLAILGFNYGVLLFVAIRDRLRLRRQAEGVARLDT